jgi:hypothetical protein
VSAVLFDLIVPSQLALRACLASSVCVPVNSRALLFSSVWLESVHYMAMLDNFLLLLGNASWLRLGSSELPCNNL